MDEKYLDFDGEPKRLVDDALAMSKTQQVSRNNGYKTDHQDYHGYIDMSKRNPDQVHVFIPKLFNVIETKVPRNVKGAIGMRPYIPFAATNPDFRDQSDLMERELDHYLDKAHFEQHYYDSAKIKTTYGTSFTEVLPFYKQATQKLIVPHPYTGEPQVQEKQIQRLLFKIKTYAPWEVYVDPYATGLTEADMCRYVIKVQLISKRQIMKLASKGAYPNFDPDEFEKQQSNASKEQADHWGISMLSDMGLPSPAGDDDMGVLLRYEAPDRYIDIWNGTVLLRDMPNPFKHGLINLSSHKHVVDPHTQNHFWGIGEMKVNRVQQALLNDLWSQTINSHQLHNQPTIYYRKNAVNPDALVRSPANRVAINSTNDRPIGDSIIDAPLHPLPRDHYMLPEAITNSIDMTAAVYDMTTGAPANKVGTASEAAMRNAAGDVRLEMEIRQSERFLSDMGIKMMSHIEQFGTIQDHIEILGQKGAMQLMFSHPQDIPGGWDYTFKGSSKVAMAMIQQRNVKELLPMLQGIPNILPGKLAEWVLETFEVPKSQAKEMIIPDQVMMKLQQQQAQQQMEAEMMNSDNEHGKKMNMEREKQAMKQQSDEGRAKQMAQGKKEKPPQSKPNKEKQNTKAYHSNKRSA